MIRKQWHVSLCPTNQNPAFWTAAINQSINQWWKQYWSIFSQITRISSSYPIRECGWSSSAEWRWRWWRLLMLWPPHKESHTQFLWLNSASWLDGACVTSLLVILIWTGFVSLRGTNRLSENQWGHLGGKHTHTHTISIGQIIRF